MGQSAQHPKVKLEFDLGVPKMILSSPIKKNFMVLGKNQHERIHSFFYILYLFFDKEE